MLNCFKLRRGTISGQAGSVAAAAMVLAAAVAVVPGVVAGKAEATNWFGASGKSGQCTGGNRTDSMPMTFFYDDLTSKTKDNSTWVRTNRINPRPLLSTSLESTANYNTDVHVFDRYYIDYCGQDWYQKATSSTPAHGGVVGYTTCNYITSSGSNRCESADVRFDLNWLDGKSDSAYRQLACHEFGHALGLKHPVYGAGQGYAEGCMNAGDGKDDYSSHDKTAHLDNSANF